MLINLLLVRHLLLMFSIALLHQHQWWFQSDSYPHNSQEFCCLHPVHPYNRVDIPTANLNFQVLRLAHEIVLKPKILHTVLKK